MGTYQKHNLQKYVKGCIIKTYGMLSCWNFLKSSYQLFGKFH